MGSLHAVRRMRASSCARLRWLRGLRGCGERAAVRPCAALLRPWREAGPELARQRSGHGVACLAAIILLTTKTLLSRKRPAQLATQLASLESSLLPATGGMRWVVTQMIGYWCQSDRLLVPLLGVRVRSSWARATRARASARARAGARARACPAW